MESGYIIAWADHHKVFQPNLYKFYLNQQLVDAKLVCDGAEMDVHAVVIAAGCKYFERILSSKLSTINVSGVSPNVLATIINFLYLGKATIEAKDLDAVLAAAKRWGVVGLGELSKEELVAGSVEFNNEDELVTMVENLGDSRDVVIDARRFNTIATLDDDSWRLEMAAKEDAVAAEFLRCQMEHEEPNNDAQQVEFVFDTNTMVLGEAPEQYFVNEEDIYAIQELGNLSAVPKSLESDESTLAASDLEDPESGD